MRKIKKILILMLLVVFAFSNVLVYANDDDDLEEEENVIEEQEIKEIEEAAALETKPVINSRRYVIYDRLCGRAVYGKDEHKKTAMASTTKIMTALIVIDKCKLEDTVTITAKAAGVGGSKLKLKTNDKITVNDLLYGLMLRSGNDAAIALAEHTAGSIEEFSKLMNNKAKEIGLVNTKFVTPHGLDDPEHYTTAYELAKLTDYALNNEKIAQIVGTKRTTITINGNPREIGNTNELLGNTEGVYGVKTGFTNNAGRCLVTSVKRGEMDLIIVVLGADTRKDRAKDSIKLIEYAYKKYQVVNVEEIIQKEFEMWKQINKNRIYIYKGVSNIEIELGEINVKKLITNENPKIEIESVTYLEAPIEKNRRVGTATIKIGEEVIEQIEVKTTKEIKKKGIKEYLDIIAKVYSGRIKICQ